MTAYVTIGVVRESDTLLVLNAALRFKPTDISKMPKRLFTVAVPAGKPTPGGKKATETRQKAERYGLCIGWWRNLPVNVQVGITDNRNTEVISGDLKAGDRVLTGENLSRLENHQASG